MAIKNKEERKKKLEAYKKYQKEAASRTKMAKEKRDKLKSTKRKSMEKKNKEKKERMLKFVEASKQQRQENESQRKARSYNRDTGSGIKKLQWLKTGI